MNKSFEIVNESFLSQIRAIQKPECHDHTGLQGAAEPTEVENDTSRASPCYSNFGSSEFRKSPPRSPSREFASTLNAGSEPTKAPETLAKALPPISPSVPSPPPIRLLVTTLPSISQALSSPSSLDPNPNLNPYPISNPASTSLVTVLPFQDLSSPPSLASSNSYPHPISNSYHHPASTSLGLPPPALISLPNSFSTVPDLLPSQSSLPETSLDPNITGGNSGRLVVKPLKMICFSSFFSRSTRQVERSLCVSILLVPSKSFVDSRSAQVINASAPVDASPHVNVWFHRVIAVPIANAIRNFVCIARRVI
jgi:hypothetical protein